MKFIQTLKNIWTIQELRQRLTITVLLVLVYRLGCYVVLPGINPNDLDALTSFTNKSGLMQLLDMFSGGAFSQALHHGVDRDPACRHAASFFPKDAARG